MSQAWVLQTTRTCSFFSIWCTSTGFNPYRGDDISDLALAGTGTVHIFPGYHNIPEHHKLPVHNRIHFPSVTGERVNFVREFSRLLNWTRAWWASRQTLASRCPASERNWGRSETAGPPWRPQSAASRPSSTGRGNGGWNWRPRWVLYPT